jgi:NDP-sugar pyrophosphorylase family protein
MPLGRQTILERLMESIAGAGVTDVTISLGYLGHLVEAVIGDGRALGLTVTYTRELEPMGTAGALTLHPGPIDDNDVILVLNGDTLTTLDLRATMDWFETTEALAAMVCVERDVLIDFGVVEADADGVLQSILEKPHLHHTVSTGINLLRGSALSMLPAGHADMPDFLMSLTSAGHQVRCLTTDALWMDLGRPEDLVAANDLLESGELP